MAKNQTTTSNSRPLALLSLTDKSGVVEFAKQLQSIGYDLLSTGGTAAVLQKAGLQVLEVSQYLDFPELMDGRVKTLHPWIHAGILHDRANPTHVQQLKEHGIRAIDVVVANLYDFSSNVLAQSLPTTEAIEYIDVGGPTMLRAAAKNHEHCLVVMDPKDYPEVVARLQSGLIDERFRRSLAAKVFEHTSAYDQMICQYLMRIDQDKSSSLHSVEHLVLEKSRDLRYGENPHQTAALYHVSGSTDGWSNAEILGGKELSYNNYLDLDAACALATDLLPKAAVVVVKHTNPCGAAVLRNGESIESLCERAIACDPQSAFGGIIAANIAIDGTAAKVLNGIFLECIAAPDFSPEALAILQQKPYLRLVKVPFVLHSFSPETQYRSIRGATLAQSADLERFQRDRCQASTKRTASREEWEDLEFAWTVVKHVKSNAIVLAKNGGIIGVGAGQMSRIDSARCALEKARQFSHDTRSAAMASDAFFPFADTVNLASGAGITAIIQPGGSKKDRDSIDAADLHGIAMIMTGVRHFRH